MKNISHIIEQLMERDIVLRLEDGELKFRAPKGAMTKDIVAKLKQYKPALISFLA